MARGQMEAVVTGKGRDVNAASLDCNRTTSVKAAAGWRGDGTGNLTD